MKIHVQLFTGDKTYETTIDIEPDAYAIKIIELLAHKDLFISEYIHKSNGPYNPSLKLSYKNIELNSMFPLKKYSIAEGETVQLYLKEKNEHTPGQTENNEQHTNTCKECGKMFETKDILFYHDGTLSPYEWVYSITTLWKWSCCGKIVSTPETCFHPNGCKFGICPDCRTDCACYTARRIRQQEEENF